MTIKKVLTIAGFDPSGGAGIQADLKVFSAFGCYGLSVLTALPVQNTCGVKQCYPIPLQAITQQLQAVFEDIRPDAIKLGMLFNKEIINILVDFLQQHASAIPIVLDPVMTAKSGDSLLMPDAILDLKNNLIPLCSVITPNLYEAAILTESDDVSLDQMELLATKMLKLKSTVVLLKGGHLDSEYSHDLYLDTMDNKQWLYSKRINTKNTHGTGCTLSAAIASCLALGMDYLSACRLSKRYIENAILAGKDLHIGHGNGPVNHFYHLWPTIDKI